eukprot:gene13024-15386_t
MTLTPAKKKAIPCSFFIQGRCKNGEDCEWLHELGKQGSGVALVNCRFYEEGRCAKGPNVPNLPESWQGMYKEENLGYGMKANGGSRLDFLQGSWEPASHPEKSARWDNLAFTSHDNFDYLPDGIWDEINGASFKSKKETVTNNERF